MIKIKITKYIKAIESMEIHENVWIFVIQIDHDITVDFWKFWTEFWVKDYFSPNTVTFIAKKATKTGFLGLIEVRIKSH